MYFVNWEIQTRCLNLARQNFQRLKRLSTTNCNNENNIFDLLRQIFVWKFQQCCFVVSLTSLISIIVLRAIDNLLKLFAFLFRNFDENIDAIWTRFVAIFDVLNVNQQFDAIEMKLIDSLMNRCEFLVNSCCVSDFSNELWI